MNERFHIRIKLPNGAELEASGPQEYVQKEREAFLEAHKSGKLAASTQNLFTNMAAGSGAPASIHGGAGSAQQPSGSPQAAGIRSPIWDSIIEVTRGMNIQLRAKFLGNKTDRDACLVLLAASQRLLNQPKPTAGQLARWLRSSGYPIQRVDRAIADGIDTGEILSSGSRRARRYELTGPGRIKAFLLAQQLTQLVVGE